MTPATAASAAPSMKVREIVRSTLMPSSAVIVRSCSHARCWRPNEVRVISQLKAIIRPTVTRTMSICEYAMRTVNSAVS